MLWKLDNATILKVVKRKARLVLPFAQDDGDEINAVEITPIQAKHKSSDTETGFAWVRARRRSSTGTRKSKRVAKTLSLTSKRSNRSLRGRPPPPHPSLPPWTLKLRQSRSSDFRQSYQMVEAPPILTQDPLIPVSPVWGLDGIMAVPSQSASRELTPSPVYGLDGTMEAKLNAPRKHNSITINFTNPRPLGEIIEEHETKPISNDHESRAPTHQRTNEDLAAKPIRVPLQPSLSRLPRSLRLTRRRRRKLNAAEDFGRDCALEVTPDVGGNGCAHVEQKKGDAEDEYQAIGHDEMGEDGMKEQQRNPPYLVMQPQRDEAAEPQADEAVSNPPSPNPPKASSPAASLKLTNRIGEWRHEVARTASHRGSSRSRSASITSRNDVEISVSKHRHTPATPSQSQTRASPPSISHSAIENSRNITLLKLEGLDDDSHQSRSTRRTRSNVGMGGDTATLTGVKPTKTHSRHRTNSSSISTSPSLRVSPTIFDDSGDKARYAPTITPSTSRGTSSPLPWDVDPTKATTTRIGDRWSAAYLESRLADLRKQENAPEGEWKKRWGPYGKDERGCLVSIGPPKKIYWNNAQSPRLGHSSHWQPPPGFDPSSSQGRQRRYDPTSARGHSW